MLGPTHRVFGALCGAYVATASGAPYETVAMTAIVATATAHGWSSPDVDQTAAWRTVAGVMPGPMRSLLAHRRLTHWWGVPAGAWLLCQHMSPDARWPVVAILIGWVSHLVGDAVFGKVPLLPWGVCVGLGLRTGGFLETGRARLFGRDRAVIPFGPTRLAIAAATAWLLAAPLTGASPTVWSPDALERLAVTARVSEGGAR
jgi:hypothetical protein